MPLALIRRILRYGLICLALCSTLVGWRAVKWPVGSSCFSSIGLINIIVLATYGPTLFLNWNRPKTIFSLCTVIGEVLGGKLFAFYQYCRYTIWYMRTNFDNYNDWYLKVHHEPIIKPLHTPKMWPKFEIRYVQNTNLYSLSAFQRTKASQVIPPYV